MFICDMHLEDETTSYSNWKHERSLSRIKTWQSNFNSNVKIVENQANTKIQNKTLKNRFLSDWEGVSRANGV